MISYIPYIKSPTHTRTHAQTSAAIHAIVDKARRAIATRNFSVFERAFAFFVTAAVVSFARVYRRRVFAARRAIVDKRMRAIATRSDSTRARAMALAVTAAVFDHAPVYTLCSFYRIRRACW